MKDTRMETGRWYPENEAEKANETVRNIVLGTLVGLLYFMLTWGIVIGF